MVYHASGLSLTPVLGTSGPTVSVIADMKVGVEDFELGRILELVPGERLELETVVPLGQETVPFFRVHDQVRESFEARVQSHPAVERIQEVDRQGDQRLYALRWDASNDHFFNAMGRVGAQVLQARGSAEMWRFELRFPDHEALSTFNGLCHDARIDLEVERVYNPTKPSLGPWYGLSERQRETLIRAVEAGYYSIPRRFSTDELAEEFDISDTAVTERLRRAIRVLTENTLLVTPNGQDEE